MPSQSSPVYTRQLVNDVNTMNDELPASSRVPFLIFLTYHRHNIIHVLLSRIFHSERIFRTTRVCDKIKNYYSKHQYDDILNFSLPSKNRQDMSELTELTRVRNFIIFIIIHTSSK